MAWKAGAGAPATLEEGGEFKKCCRSANRTPRAMNPPPTNPVSILCQLKARLHSTRLEIPTPRFRVSFTSRLRAAGSRYRARTRSNRHVHHDRIRIGPKSVRCVTCTLPSSENCIKQKVSSANCQQRRVGSHVQLPNARVVTLRPPPPSHVPSRLPLMVASSFAAWSCGTGRDS